MKPAPFTYCKARSGEEALALLAEHGGDARFLAGGQSLVAMMNFRFARPSALIDLNGCHDLAGIGRDDAHLVVGAMTRQRAAELCPLVRVECPLLADALALAGPLTIRNRGTVGGSLANAFPTACLLAVATCLEAEIVLESADGDRTVPARDFIVAEMTTAIEEGELLRAIRFPVCGPGHRTAFRKSGNHAGGSAEVVVAGHAALDPRGKVVSAAISVLGIDAVPVRLDTVERLLSEDGWHEDGFRDAWRQDCALLDDEGEKTLQYRRSVAEALTADVAADLLAAGRP